MAKRCLTSLGLKHNPEQEQDIVIHLVYKSMPKLTEDKLQYALQYLWTSARNFTLTSIVSAKKHNNCESIDSAIEPEYNSTYSTDPIDLEADYERNLTRLRIMDEIDLRLKGQHIVNTTNSVFLLLLKQYIIDNDYDVRGFGAYVMEAMHLKLSTYRAIAARIDLRTMQFNEPADKPEPTKNRARQVIAIKNGRANIYKSVREAARVTDTDPGNISTCCLSKGRRKSVNGFKWFYLTEKTKWMHELQRQQASVVTNSQNSA